MQGKDGLSVWDWMSVKTLDHQDSTGKHRSLDYDKTHGTNTDKANLQEEKAMEPPSLPSSLIASDLVSGGSERAISAEQPLRDLCSTRPNEYAVKSTLQEIDWEETLLISWCRSHNRILSAADVVSFESQAGVRGGGDEHDGWVVARPDGNKFFIRRTIKDSYGFAHSSPFQYLQRLVDVSDQIPTAPIDFLGMSQNSRGNGVIWTTQPYIEGVKPEEANLQKHLKKEGWKKLGDIPGLYEHKSGIKMHDAQAKNFIQTPGGKMIPVDVFFEGIAD